MQCPHKALQQETRKLFACEPQKKTLFAPFYRNDLILFFSLCSEYMSEVCKVCCVNLGHGDAPRKVLIM